MFEISCSQTDRRYLSVEVLPAVVSQERGQGELLSFLLLLLPIMTGMLPDLLYACASPSGWSSITSSSSAGGTFLFLSPLSPQLAATRAGLRLPGKRTNTATLKHDTTPGFPVPAPLSFREGRQPSS